MDRGAQTEPAGGRPAGRPGTDLLRVMCDLGVIVQVERRGRVVGIDDLVHSVAEEMLLVPGPVQMARRLVRVPEINDCLDRQRDVTPVVIRAALVEPNTC